jgi:hypothetical protein
MRLWNNMHQVYLKSKDWKAKQFKVLGEIKTKGPKQDSQNRPRSPMPEAKEKWLSVSPNPTGSNFYRRVVIFYYGTKSQLW